MHQELKHRIQTTLAAYRAEIVAAIAGSTESNEPYESIARRFEVSTGYVYKLAKANGLRRRADKKAGGQ